MSADSIFFVFGMVGALAGYIIGDLQRELRWRRDARKNLELAVNRLSDPNAVPVRVTDRGTDAVATSPNGNGDSDGGTSGTLRSVRDGQARRRAVSRPDFGNRPSAPVRGRRADSPNASAIGVGYDCG